MNAVFLAIVLISFAVAALRELTGLADAPVMDALGMAMIDAAKGSVELAIGLVGVMALFLGLMKVAEAGGLLVIIARVLRPAMTRLFPDVPPDHPAMGAMVLNMSANALGLGNAATPFGIRAMQALESLNPRPGVATDSMALFLAINTSSVTLLPTGVIALRASAGSLDPAGIVPTTLFATICSTTVAIVTAKLLARYWSQPEAVATAGVPQVDAAERGWQDATGDGDAEAALTRDVGEGYPTWVSLAVFACVLAIVPLSILYGSIIAPWIIPGLMVTLLGFGALRGVAVYETFVEGAKAGFEVALRIIPYLVAILVAVAMFRASGAMELVVGPLGAVTAMIGLPADALPMALLRPLSGSGAYGILAATIENPAIGPDSYVGYLVSTIQGSTETTFYVLAVYYGAVQIRRFQHTLVAALLAA
ncbi:MAG: nucleoside recognition domain-containing protein, partial [Acetobacterales bacterium]